MNNNFSDQTNHNSIDYSRQHFSSQLNQIEAELRHLRKLIQTIPQIIWQADIYGQMTYFNSRWYELTELDIDAGLGDGYLQVMHPDDREICITYWQQALTQSQAFNLQVRIRQSDQNYCCFLMQARPIYDEQGCILEWVGTFTNIDTLQQSTQNLTSQTEFLNALLSNLSDGIVACDRTGNLTLFNRASREFHGLSSVENIRPEQWAEYYDLYLADGKTRMQAEEIPLFRALQGESVRDVEMMIVPKNGKSRFLLANGDPIINNSQEKLGAVVAMRDITEHKQTLSLLDERDAFLRSIYEGTEVSIFVVDVLENGEFVYVGMNPVHERLTGLSVIDIQGKTPEQFLDTVSAKKIRQQYQQCIIRGELISYEEELCFQGQQTWWLTRINPLRDRTGRIYRLIGTSIDITARKQAEIQVHILNNRLELKVEERTEELEENAVQFRATFEQVAVGFAHVALDGTWLRVNQKFCEIVGYSETEILQLTFQDITHPEDLETDLDYVRQLLVGEIDHYSMEKRYIRQDGTFVWVEMTPSLMRDRITNQPQYFIAVIEEIGERKQIQLELHQQIETLAKITAQLTKRNQELDQFAYVASHDLKAPLRAIANISQWIEEDLDGNLPQENQRQLEILRGRVHRMEALINGLLEYSRIGRVDYPLETVDVNQLLTKVIKSLDVPTNFQIEIASPMPILTTRKVHLFQVFSQLINNAIQHHHSKEGKVQITARDTGEFYEFSIRDDGIGIAPQYHQKIFTIFQTLEARDKKESTGVGLSIVKKILDVEGGNIYVDSQIGVGVNMIFIWPK